jgi:hypothetical protein
VDVPPQVVQVLAQAVELGIAQFGRSASGIGQTAKRCGDPTVRVAAIDERGMEVEK